MARSRRGGGSSMRRPAPAPRRAAPAPAAKKPASSAPATQSAAPPASGGGMLSGIGSTIAQGMAFGTGSAIAHQAVGAVAGSFSGGGSSTEPVTGQPVEQMQQPQGVAQSFNSSEVCSMDKQMFYECLQTNKNDPASCNFLYDQLKQCQQNQMQFQ